MRGSEIGMIRSDAQDFLAVYLKFFQVREDLLVVLSEIELEDASGTVQLSSALLQIVKSPHKLTIKAQVFSQVCLAVEVRE